MFTLNLVTPDKKLVSGREVEEVTVPAFSGELDILPGHAPLMTTLSTGILKYRLKDEPGVEHVVAIGWGYLQVSPVAVNILAETAERPDEIDVKRADESLLRAESAISSASLDGNDVQKIQSKIAKATVRKEVASMQKGSSKSETKH